MKIMRAWDAGRNKVRYIYRDENNRIKIGEAKTEWFFYVRNQEYDSHKSIFNYFKDEGIVNKYFREEYYTRVYVDRIHNNELLDKNMEYVWEYRDRKLNYLLKVLDDKDIPHFEADLRVYQRWMLTENIEIEPDYRVAMFDIETNDEKMSGRPVPGEFQILSFSIVDAESGKGAWICSEDESDQSEKDMLIKMLKLFNQFDVICSWNGCFVKDTPILMVDGTTKKVQDVVVGDQLIGFDNKSKSTTTQVLHVMKHKKYKTIYEIETESGLKIQATEEHPFLTTYDGVFKYIRTPNLRSGDYLCQFRRIDLEIELHDFDIDDYKFAGLMMTDGNIRGDKTERLSFSNTNPKIYKWMERYLDRKNINYYKYAHKPDNQNQKICYQYQFNDESLRNMLYWMGVPKGRKTEQQIDCSNIFKQNKNRIKSFLIGCWYGDGFKTTNNIQIANRNITLQYWFKRLFNRIGNHTDRVRDSKDGKNYFDAIRVSDERNTIPKYFVDKYFRDDIKKTGIACDVFNGKIPCTRSSFDRFCNDNDLVNNLYFDKIKNIQIIKYDDYVYNFETTTHNYVANDLIVHNCHFDFPYIKARCQYHGLVYDWRKKFFQDHLERARKLGPSLPSYSLEYVAQHFLGEGKVDRNERIIDLFRNDRQMLKKYNLRDSQLMTRIETKTKFLSAARNINVIGRCFVDDIYISRKVDMLVLLQAFVDGKYHFRTKVKKEELPEDTEKFAGAYVFEPQLGLHDDVSVFDVGSLYPNIIKTFNVSPDTLITDENRKDVPPDKIIRTPNGQFFRKDFQGILAKVVEIIVSGRNKYKALMKTVTPDSMEHKMYDSLQYAYKSFGLSFYGVTGNQYARFFDTRVSESITLTGQHFIKNISTFLKGKGHSIVYGDSITGDRYTWVRKNGIIKLISFEELFHYTTNREIKGTKEYGDSSFEVLTKNFQTGESEFKPINKVIRHQVEKEIYYYRCRNGVTSVTEDHSLIDNNGNEFKPTDYSIDACSLKTIPIDISTGMLDLSKYIRPYRYFLKKFGKYRDLKKTSRYILFPGLDNTFKRYLDLGDRETTKKFLKLMAHYICNGSSSTPETTSTRNGMSIASEDEQLIVELKEAYDLFFSYPSGILKPDYKFRKDLKEQGGWDVTNKIFKLQGMNLLSAVIFKQLCGQKAYGKFIPDFIFSLDKDYIRYFVEQLIMGDGSIEGGNFRLDSSSVKWISGMSQMFNILEIKHSINYNEKKKVYRISSYKNENYSHKVENKCIKREYTGYVYDLDVQDNHNFVDACGNLVLHNTDSNFVKIVDRNTIKQLLLDIKGFCNELSKKFNCDFCSIEMAHDKRFSKFLLVAKKNYAGYLDFVDGKYLETPSFYVAGLECKRTDKAKLVVESQKDILLRMLSKEGYTLEQCIEFINDLENKIVHKQNVTIDDIKIAQKLTKEVEEYKANSMHLRVVEDMEKEGQAVYVGDKIEYYIYSVDSKGKPIPRHVSKFDGSYARIYYWNNIIYPPLMRVLSVVYPNYNWDRFLFTKKMSKNSELVGRALW